MTKAQQSALLSAISYTAINSGLNLQEIIQSMQRSGVSYVDLHLINLLVACGKDAEIVRVIFSTRDPSIYFLRISEVLNFFGVSRSQQQQ